MRIGYLWALLLSFSLVSCFEIEETIALEKDGTGKFAMVMDMSGLLKDEMLSGLIKGAQEEEGAKPFPEQDSLIYGRDLPAEEKSDNPDLWNRTTMRIESSEKKKLLKFTLMLDFKDVSEIGYAIKNFEKLNANKNSNEPSMGSMMPDKINYTLRGKTLTRTTVMDKSTSSEDDEMANMFLKNATYKVTYIMPGRVKKATMKTAQTDGKKVSTELSLGDMMDGKPGLDGSISF